MALNHQLKSCLPDTWQAIVKVSIANKGDMPCGCGPKHGAYEEAESRDLMLVLDLKQTLF